MFQKISTSRFGDFHIVFSIQFICFQNNSTTFQFVEYHCNQPFSLNYVFNFFVDFWSFPLLLMPCLLDSSWILKLEIKNYDFFGLKSMENHSFTFLFFDFLNFFVGKMEEWSLVFDSFRTHGWKHIIGSALITWFGPIFWKKSQFWVAL